MSASRRTSAPRPDRPRRRGDVPRLGRRGLDVPLARARGARVPRPGGARPPRHSRRTRQTATRSTARAHSARRSSRRPAAERRRSCASLRYALTAGRGLRATGHTASDQVETVLYRIVSSGSTRGIRARRADGVVRPLLAALAGGDGGRTAGSNGLSWRVDSTNAADEARADPRAAPAAARGARSARAREPLRARGATRPRLPRALEALARRARSPRSTGRVAPTSAAASGRCAGTTCCASRAPSSGARGVSRATVPGLVVRSPPAGRSSRWALA